MRARLVFSIVSTILEEIAIAVIVLWGLPQLGILIPLWGLIIIMVAWAGYAVFTHRIGTRALKQEHPVGLPNMIGCTGRVVSPLAPSGLVRIRGELWVASSTGGEMKEGEEVTVVGQERLKLIVQGNPGASNSESGK